MLEVHDQVLGCLQVLEVHDQVLGCLQVLEVHDQVLGCLQVLEVHDQVLGCLQVLEVHDQVLGCLQVLEVHDRLEEPHSDMSEHGDLDDRERAIVKEMCNVSCCFDTRWCHVKVSKITVKAKFSTHGH